MEKCFICLSEGVVATDLSEAWIKELKHRDLVPYACTKCEEKWIANNIKAMYSEDGKSIGINDDTIPIKDRQQYLWEKYKIVYDRNLFAFGIRELDGSKVIDIYVEDDESLYLKTSFNEYWLNDLMKVAQKIKKILKKR